MLIPIFGSELYTNHEDQVEFFWPQVRRMHANDPYVIRLLSFWDQVESLPEVWAWKVADASWHVSVSIKNRTLLAGHAVSRRVLSEIINCVRNQGLILDEHITVFGTYLQAWANRKIVIPKLDRDSTPQTEEKSILSVQKSVGGVLKLNHAEHALPKSQKGLLVDVELLSACGTAECDAAHTMPALRKGQNSPSISDAYQGYDHPSLIEVSRDLPLTLRLWRKTRRVQLISTTPS